MWLSVGLMVLSIFSAGILIPVSRDQDYLVIFASGAIGLSIYAGVLAITGYRRRSLQTLSAIIACGSILTLLFVAEYVLLQSFLGTRVANIVGTLIIIWSVPVEGHIIARAIQQHWYAGIVIAMFVFIVQVGFQQTLATSG